MGSSTLAGARKVLQWDDAQSQTLMSRATEGRAQANLRCCRLNFGILDAVARDALVFNHVSARAIAASSVAVEMVLPPKCAPVEKFQESRCLASLMRWNPFSAHSQMT